MIVVNLLSNFTATTVKLWIILSFGETSVGFRYLHSLVETILIFQHFNKPSVEQPTSKQELVDFWMDFLVEATKKDISSVRFPVSNTG